MARDSKSDQIYAQLRDDILTGSLRPGESLGVLGVADRFSASRTPVRDAFLRLESDGLVSLIDRQGARVSPISIRSVRELFELRILLESSAIRHVAEAAVRDDKIRRVFVDLAHAFGALAGQAPSPQRRDQFYTTAEAFDEAVITHTRNQHLSRIVNELRPHIARLRFVAHSPNRLEPALSEHLTMCRAIVDGDAEGAAAACSEHLDNTQQAVLANVLNLDGLDVPVDLISR